MPALRFLGRRWHIAADDLPFPSLLGVAWHLAIAILIAINLAYVVERLGGSCFYRSQHLGYLSAHLGCFVCNSILHAWTFFESIRGSIFQVHLRQRVGTLVFAMLFFYALTIGNNAYGTRLVYLAHRQPACAPVSGPIAPLDERKLTEAIVVATWVSLFIGLIAMLATLNLFSTYETASSPWLSRCQVFRAMCCLGVRAPKKGKGGVNGDGSGPDGGGGEVAAAAAALAAAAEEEEEGEEVEEEPDKPLSPMVVIANIFTHIFGSVDMTLTDYVAAFTLVGVQHRHAKPAFAYRNAPPPPWMSSSSAPGGGSFAVSTPSCKPSEPGDTGAGVLTPPPVVEMAADSGWQPREPAALVLPETLAADPMDALPIRPRTTTTAAATPASAISTPPTTSGLIGTPADATTDIETGAVTSGELRSPVLSNGSKAPVTGLPRGSTGSAIDVEVAAGPVTPHPAVAATAATTANGPTSARDSKPVIPDGEFPPAAVSIGGGPGRGSEQGGAPGVASPSGRLPQSLEQMSEGLMWDGKYVEGNASLEVMEEAVHYFRFATAVYGWKMFLWMNRTRVTNCCKLCLGRSCGCCRQTAYFFSGLGPDTGPSEGCCSAVKLLEREAITQVAEVPDQDILYVCYKNKVGGLLPYYIALDRSRRSIVICIRGSLSNNDVVTDLLCEPAEFKVPGVPSTLWAHRGILRSTQAIWEDIQRQGVLEGALGEYGGPTAPQHPSERARSIAHRLKGACTGWRVVVTGHSLGGGVTGLLGPLLRTRYPNIRCWAYAPPGGLMSPQAAGLTREYCISVVNAKDMIPRLGVATMEQLVQRLVTAGVHCRVSKAHVMGRLVALGQQPPADRLFMPSGDLTPELQHVLQTYNHRLQGTPSSRVGETFGRTRDFLPPGHILYVERRKPGKDHQQAPGDPACFRCSCNVCLLDTSSRHATYACRWIRPEDLLAGGLVVSRSMFLDHVPDNTAGALQLALDQMRQACRPGPVATSADNTAAASTAATTAAAS